MTEEKSFTTLTPAHTQHDDIKHNGIDTQDKRHSAGTLSAIILSVMAFRLPPSVLSGRASHSNSGDRRVPWLKKSIMVWIWQHDKRTDDCKIIQNCVRKLMINKSEGRGRKRPKLFFKCRGVHLFAHPSLLPSLHYKTFYCRNSCCNVIG